jgi:hypothetical protein
LRERLREETGAGHVAVVNDGDAHALHAAAASGFDRAIVCLGLPRVLLTVGVWGDQAASASL